jgi:hypothetical protein
MQNLVQDLKYSGRQIFNNPTFAITAVISLALGIGATTAIFSVLYAALINPYPYPRANRIFRLNMKGNSSEPDSIDLNGLQLRQLQQSPVVESVLAMDFHAISVTGSDYPQNIVAMIPGAP